MSDAFLHNTAVVDPGAYIGEGSRIWHFSHVCGGARIGRIVSLGQGVFVCSRAVIGDRCKIQNNVSLYDEVILEEDVFCGPSMVFTNVINPRAFIERKAEFRVTLVRRGATLGANCTILCGVEVGSFAFVGAGSVVTRNVPDFALVVGVPGVQAGWMSAHGDRLDLPIDGDGEAQCRHTGDRYQLRSGRLTRTEEVL